MSMSSTPPDAGVSIELQVGQSISHPQAVAPRMRCINRSLGRTLTGPHNLVSTLMQANSQSDLPSLDEAPNQARAPDAAPAFIFQGSSLRGRIMFGDSPCHDPPADDSFLYTSMNSVVSSIGTPDKQHDICVEITPQLSHPRQQLTPVWKVDQTFEVEDAPPETQKQQHRRFYGQYS